MGENDYATFDYDICIFILFTIVVAVIKIIIEFNWIDWLNLRLVKYLIH